MTSHSSLTVDQISKILMDLSEDDASNENTLEVAIIPPSPDELTDEEAINDDELPEQSIFQDVAGKLELIIHNKEREADESSKPPPMKKRTIVDNNSIPKWKKIHLSYKEEMDVPSQN